MIVASLLDRLEHDSKKQLCTMLELEPVEHKRYGMVQKDYGVALEREVKRLKDDDKRLRQLALDAMIVREIQVNTWSLKKPMPLLKGLATEYGLNLRQIRASVTPKKTKAKPKAKAKQIGRAHV